MELTKSIKNSERPFVIAGPCSAESSEQMMNVAKELSEMSHIHLLRAGIWKPRTSPDSFEGVGEEALSWLVEAGKSYNLPTTTEVANSKHVEKALEAGVDVLWVGARTTVNPFAVQEIADALNGTSIPVMVKNPVNPDLKLWLGAIERLERIGISDIVAIHRGFSIYKHHKYRNVPNWEIPIALREKRPDLPMICDPSHISGKRSGLLEVSQKAMDLNFDALMIETHPSPDDAWSDPEQQLTPKQLGQLLGSLVLRTEELSDDVASQIKEIREQVSLIDDHIFDLLSDRMRHSDLVGNLKRDNNIMILQQEHWTKLIVSRLGQAGEYDLSESFVRTIMDAIHQESIRHQVRVMNESKKKDHE